MGAHSWRMAVSCTLPNLHFIIEAICQPFVTCNYWCILLGDGSFLYTPKFALSCWAALSTLCYLQLVHTPWGRLCPVYSQIWASLLNSFVNPLSPAMGAYSRGKAMSCTYIPKFALYYWNTLSTLCYLQLVHTPGGRLRPGDSQKSSSSTSHHHLYMRSLA